jgi:hypothetical protein
MLYIYTDRFYSSCAGATGQGGVPACAREGGGRGGGGGPALERATQQMGEEAGAARKLRRERLSVSQSIAYLPQFLAPFPMTSLDCFSLPNPSGRTKCL